MRWWVLSWLSCQRWQLIRRFDCSIRVPEKSTVFADQSLITQLLINLIGNSIKYGVRGGKVTVRAPIVSGAVPYRFR